ncbi:phenazine biosynthesis PhzC/PhzF protein [Podospora australis]|uniref:Phenazine biosynthesis PhzC/PhzF protein n=1 Tax=Podospora australis TaxID=1536484 RepID=A0AAN7AGT1_9PEZI|nr:phenazine biosynthesis PhzC/PhzF protein [Podospora australis]
MTTTHTQPTLDFVTLDVFTTSRFTGNPLAVIFIPSTLTSSISQETKQLIAREFNLSETVFLHTLPDEPNLSSSFRRAEIFTIEEELPFAGHPTIGTAFLVLEHLGWKHVTALQTKAGPIGIERVGERDVKAAIPHAVHIHSQTLSSLLYGTETEALSKTAIEDGLSPHAEIRERELQAKAVSIVRGMTFLLVELPSLDLLGKVKDGRPMDFGKIKGLIDEGEWGKSFVARYYYVPTAEPSVGSGGTRTWKFQTRMVELGFEDPATGSAACTLASYLTLAAEGEGVTKEHFEIVQGVEMGRRSEITVDAVAEVGGDGQKRVKELFLGGSAEVVMRGSISV